MKSTRSLKGWVVSMVLTFSLLLLFASFAGAVDYTYDDLNRLIRVEYDDGMTIEYVYDEIGNRLQKKAFVVIPRCKGDFDDDGDVDGSDLATFAAGGTGITLEEFAAEFGRMNCP